MNCLKDNYKDQMEEVFRTRTELVNEMIAISASKKVENNGNGIRDVNNKHLDKDKDWNTNKSKDNHKDKDKEWIMAAMLRSMDAAKWGNLVQDLKG